jgi:hypothetical protein
MTYIPIKLNYNDFNYSGMKVDPIMVIKEIMKVDLS